MGLGGGSLVLQESWWQATKTTCGCRGLGLCSVCPPACAGKGRSAAWPLSPHCSGCQSSRALAQRLLPVPPPTDTGTAVAVRPASCSKARLVQSAAHCCHSISYTLTVVDISVNKPDMSFSHHQNVTTAWRNSSEAPDVFWTSFYLEMNRNISYCKFYLHPSLQLGKDNLQMFLFQQLGIMWKTTLFSPHLSIVPFFKKTTTPHYYKNTANASRLHPGQGPFS